MSCYLKNSDSKIRIAKVFSCPGQRELNAGRPIAGVTGSNSEIIDEFIQSEFSQKPSRWIGEWSLKDILVTNAGTDPQFMKSTQRTEAKDQILKSNENLKRLASELAGKLLIFAYGEKAQMTLRELQAKNMLVEGAVIIKAPHLSFSCINRKITHDINGNKLKRGTPGNTRKRLEWIFLTIIKPQMEQLYKVQMH